jgi:glycosyltransferase involved in cell wall biosynthesis
MAILTIHATNVTGLGACQVVVSFLQALESLQTSYERIDCYVPEYGPVAEYVATTDKLRVLPFQRRGLKVLSRLMECMFPSRYFDIGEHLIVLGDLPLRTACQQLVLVHQPHLQYPRVNSRVGRTATFHVMRAVTTLNSPYVDRVIVQTDAMASGLHKSYKDWASRDCIKVIGQPPPSWFTLVPSNSSFPQNPRGLRLFYPAAEYPHKNHAIFADLLPLDVTAVIDRLVLTLPTESFASAPKWLACVGRLNHAECLAEYGQADSLIFPSVLESYGLPLVEAMVMGIPVIAADLPYARVLCGDEGIYFNPDSPESLVEACKELKVRLIDGWRPDWSSSLEAMPKTWTAVVQGFLEEFK